MTKDLKEGLIKEAEMIKERITHGLKEDEVLKAIAVLWRAGELTLEDFERKFGRDVLDYLVEKNYASLEERIKLTSEAKTEFLKRFTLLDEFEFLELPTNKFEGLGYTYNFTDESFFELAYFKPYDTHLFIDWYNKRIFELYQIEKEGKKVAKKRPAFIDEITKSLRNLLIIDDFELNLDYLRLFTEITNYVKSQAYLLNEEDYLLESSFIILSWIPEILDVAPYLRFYAPKGSGKTTNLEAIARLAYRSLLSVSPTFASIPRLAHYHGAFLTIDEARIKEEKLEGEENVWDLLRARSRRGVSYVKAGTDPYSVLALNVFGLTIISGKKPIPDDIEDRCFRIEIQRKRNFRPKKVSKAEIEKLLLELSKLRLWVIKENRIENLKTAIEKNKEALLNAGFESRFVDIVAPLLFLIPREYQAKVLPYIKEKQIWRYEEERTSEEAAIFQAVFELLKKTLPDVDLETFSREVEISVQEIVKEYVSILGQDYDALLERDKRSLSTRVGIVLRKLGVKTRKKEHGHYAVVSYKIFRELANRYLYEDYRIDLPVLSSITDLINPSSVPSHPDTSDTSLPGKGTPYPSYFASPGPKTQEYEVGGGVKFEVKVSEVSEVSASLSKSDKPDTSDTSDTSCQEIKTPLNSYFAFLGPGVAKYTGWGAPSYKVSDVSEVSGQQGVELPRIIITINETEYNIKEHEITPTPSYASSAEATPFSKLSRGYTGLCSYCGSEGYIEWEDQEGFPLCERCVEDELERLKQKLDAACPSCEVSFVVDVDD